MVMIKFNTLTLAQAVNGTAKYKGSSWRKQATHKLLRRSACSEWPWWTPPSLLAVSAAETGC